MWPAPESYLYVTAYSCRHLLVSWGWFELAVNVKASWGQKKPKDFHLCYFYLYSCSSTGLSQHSLVMSRTHEEGTCCLCVQVRATEIWKHKQNKKWQMCPWKALSSKGGHGNPGALVCCFLCHPRSHRCGKCPFLGGIWRRFLVSTWSRPLRVGWRCFLTDD